MKPTATNPRSHWGHQIAEARREAGLTQVALAVECGRDPQTISRIERGDGLLLETYAGVGSHLGLTLIEVDQ